MTLAEAVGWVALGVSVITLLSVLWLHRQQTVHVAAVAEELLLEAQRARQLSTVLARFLEEGGVIEAEWDSEGNLRRFTQVTAPPQPGSPPANERQSEERSHS